MIHYFIAMNGKCILRVTEAEGRLNEKAARHEECRTASRGATRRGCAPRGELDILVSRLQVDTGCNFFKLADTLP